MCGVILLFPIRYCMAWYLLCTGTASPLYLLWSKLIKYKSTGAIFQLGKATDEWNGTEIHKKNLSFQNASCPTSREAHRAIRSWEQRRKRNVCFELCTIIICSPELFWEGLRWEIFNYHRDCIVYFARPASWQTDRTAVKNTVHLPVMNTIRMYEKLWENLQG